MAPGEVNPARWRVGVAVLGGALAWSLHLLGAWLLAEFRCVAAREEAATLGIGATSALLLALSAAALSAAVFATWVGWIDGRRLTGTESPYLYLARFGKLTNAVFTLVIAFQSVPIFYFLRGC